MFFIFFILFSSFIYGELDVYANKFVFDKKHNTIDLRGDVSIKREKDKILAQNIKVLLDSSKKVVSFLATKKVKLEYNSDKQGFYIQSEKINFKNYIYIISGNVKMKNIETKEIITANKITINAKTDVITIDGTKSKPVNIKLKLKQN